MKRTLLRAALFLTGLAVTVAWWFMDRITAIDSWLFLRTLPEWEPTDRTYDTIEAGTYHYPAQPDDGYVVDYDVFADDYGVYDPLERSSNMGGGE